MGYGLEPWPGFSFIYSREERKELKPAIALLCVSKISWLVLMASSGRVGLLGRVWHYFSLVMWLHDDSPLSSHVCRNEALFAVSSFLTAGPLVHEAVDFHCWLEKTTLTHCEGHPSA